MEPTALHDARKRSISIQRRFAVYFILLIVVSLLQIVDISRRPFAAELPTAAKSPPPEITEQKHKRECLPPGRNLSMFSNVPFDCDDPSLIPFRGWDASPIVIPKYKLLFYTTPKNSATVFKKLFRRMMGFSDWQETKYQFGAIPHSPQMNGLLYLYNCSNELLEEIWDPAGPWTRAVFVRDPAERALSAYLHKVVRKKGAYFKRNCCDAHRPKKDQHAERRPKFCSKVTLDAEPNISFATFVYDIIPNCNDPHWASQSAKVPAKAWELINFVGDFDRIQEDTRKLLQQIGAWKEYGESGWGLNNGAIFEENPHGSQVSGKVRWNQYYGNGESLGENSTALSLLDEVKAYYAADYDFFHTWKLQRIYSE